MSIILFPRGVSFETRCRDDLINTVLATISKTTAFESFIQMCNAHSYEWHQRDSLGNNALTQATLIGNLPLVTQFLKQTSAPDLINTADVTGCTPLFIASFYGHFTIVEKFLEFQNLNTNSKTCVEIEFSGSFVTPKGATPLWAALQKARSVAIAILLLDHQAEIPPDSSLDEEGRRILTEALVFKEERLKKIDEALSTFPSALIGLINDSLSPKSSASKA